MTRQRAEQTWYSVWNRLLSRIVLVHTEQEIVGLLAELERPKQPVILAFINAHGMNEAVTKPDFCDALAQADIVLRDGSGIAILYRLLGIAPGLNMNGTDLIPRVLAAYRTKSVALWGTRDPHLSEAGKRIEAMFGVRIVSQAHGFFEVDHYLQLARQCDPDLVLLGMGMPKQELIAQRLRENAARPLLIICGGAIIDFLGGKVERAPVWMRRARIEWIYRLWQEPKRLFRRYVIGNPVFIGRAVFYRIKGISRGVS